MRVCYYNSYISQWNTFMISSSMTAADTENYHWPHYVLSPCWRAAVAGRQRQQRRPAYGRSPSGSGERPNISGSAAKTRITV